MSEAALKNDPQPESKCCGTCGCKEVAAVSALTSARIQGLVSNRSLLFDLMASHGSPLNIVLPEEAVSNHQGFSQELVKRGIRGEVLFTSKPNKSRAILMALANKNSKVDVSSAGALLHALECGLKGSDIQASGPKSLDYIALALRYNVTISVDSISEIQQILSLQEKMNEHQAVNVLLRLSGFKSERVKVHSGDLPFGVGVEGVGEALTLFSQFKEHLKFEGVHFHLLNGTNTERIVAFEGCIEIIRRALQIGLTPNVINIGGGFKIRYAAESSEWAAFQSYIRASVLGKVDPITWDGTGLGYRIEGGRIAGSAAYSDHFPPEAGVEELSNFLDETCPELDGHSVSTILRDMMLELRVEPGRGILDQAGCTLARVISVKETANGKPLIMLDINHTNLGSRERYLLTQPIFIPAGPRSQTAKSYFLFGNLCTAKDLIQHQKVYPGFVPEVGDLVVFINTAAYHMDFSESEVLHHPVAKKVAVFGKAENHRCFPDKTVTLSQVVAALETV